MFFSVEYTIENKTASRLVYDKKYIFLLVNWKTADGN